MALKVFPTLIGLAFPVPRVVSWNTVDQTALSGARARYGYYSYPIYKYTAKVNILRSIAPQDFQTLLGFINSVQGQLGLWLFNDVQDNTATNQGFGVGDGSSTSFQLVRSLGGFVEPVFFPDLVAGLVTQVMVGGTPTTAYTVSATGQIVFNTPPGSGQLLAWTGTFKWPCRFDADETEFSYFMQNFFSVREIKFSTEKVL